MTDPVPQKSILITWPGYSIEDATLGGALTAAGYRPVLRPKTGFRAPADVARLLPGVVGAIVSTDPFPADVLRSAPDLCVIARVGVGTDSIDLAAASSRGVVVTTTPGANESVVADHTVALLLAAVRRVVENDASIRSGEWNRVGDLTPFDLSGRTIGLVGLGTIGGEVARRLAGFDVEVLFTDPAVATHGAATRVPIDELLRRSDIVSLHVPLTGTNRHLIGRPELASLRRGAILVNTSRGGLVDEDALVDALRSGHLAAAALDVFEVEPPRDRRLAALPNVVLSPHIAGLSPGSIQEMTRRATRSVLRVLAGDRPDGVANPDVYRAVRPLAAGGAGRG
ncbi:phosphoglycerate dehydrogenase [Dactylosporangium sucinum]|uniref:D-isomer specific 2-hydroxyacid dehydrogenase n=1 Tax=Dactylosporangium sucinum TaxID=1424081 RepID=A0A917WX61_9ACTN|nr:phosphoglycerate dehydrogenase [Dactylosporangium sucinum]GGM36343.1 D-isomer specific 2-hydroxyacid dehydrogenase [Dactylosporangium sucinum]